MTAYVRTLGAALGTVGLYLGPMAKPHRMATLTLGCLAAAAETTAGAQTPRASGGSWSSPASRSSWHLARRSAISRWA